jgi:hypothetical protein
MIDTERGLILMNVDYHQEVETVKTWRIITTGPMSMKNHSFVWNMTMKKFQELNGREPSSDDDVWIEPHDDGIAYCFLVKTTEKG